MRDYFSSLGDSAYPNSTDPRARAITRFQELLLISDISSGVCIFIPPGSHGLIATFLPDGSQIVTVSFSQSAIQVWDILGPSIESSCPLTFKLPVSSDFESYHVYSLTCSPDGRFLLLGLEGCIVIWNISTGQRIATLTAHSGQVYDLAFFPGGRRLLSMSFPLHKF